MKSSILVPLMLFLSACSAPNKHHVKYIASPVGLGGDSTFYIEYEHLNSLPFRGELIAEHEDNAYSMMYPGGAGLAGFIVGIATHAVVESGRQNSKETAAVELASQVLSPFNDVIKGLDVDEVVQNAMSNQSHHVVINGSSSFVPAAVWKLKISPMFFIAQNHSSLRIKNIVSIYPTLSEAGVPVYENMIESVHLFSSTGLIEDVDFLEMHMESAAVTLLSESIELAVSDAMKNLNQASSAKTFKFLERGGVAYERANLISDDCSKVVVRTLRNWIKSVPVSLHKNRVVSAFECAKSKSKSDVRPSGFMTEPLS